MEIVFARKIRIAVRSRHGRLTPVLEGFVCKRWIGGRLGVLVQGLWKRLRRRAARTGGSPDGEVPGRSILRIGEVEQCEPHRHRSVGPGAPEGSPERQVRRIGAYTENVQQARTES